MRRTMLTAAAALIAVALPLAMATSASAQLNPVVGGGAKSGGGGGGGAVRGAPAGGGGGMVGGGAFRGGGGAPSVGLNPRVGAGPNLGTGIGPRTAWTGSRSGWSGPRPGWDGRHYRRNRFIGPGIGFGTGLLLGGAFASQPYYYGDDYYDYPYDDGYVYGAPVASPEDIAYCRQRYRSYDIRTGTYLNNDGNRYPCP